jgi:hypothetical protein
MNDDAKGRYKQSAERAGISRSGRGIGVLVRLQSEEIDLLDAYCEKHSITRPEALRVGLGAITIMEGADRG